MTKPAAPTRTARIIIDVSELEPDTNKFIFGITTEGPSAPSPTAVAHILQIAADIAKDTAAETQEGSS